MRIALVAHLRHPIREPFLGGMEAHTFRLARALGERGHQVTLFASGDSDPSFRLDPVVPLHNEVNFPWARYRQDPGLYTYLDTAFAAACHRIFGGAYDIVHNNGLHRFVLAGACATGQPTVTSLHVPPFDPLQGSVHRAVASNHRYAVVSRAQLAQWWPQDPPDELSAVHNGLDLREWPFAPRAGDHALWCGRITPNKGPHFAIAAARRLGIALRLFGYLEDRDYYEAEIAPLLDDRITYGGNLATDRLREEMQQAAVLVFTPCWEEPFGLVVIEAMASGTPIASFDRGAVREIVDAECGRLARHGDIDGLAHAIAQARTLPRQAPRHRVETAFTTDHMLDAYEALYGLALAGAPSFPDRDRSTAFWQSLEAEPGAI